MRRALKWVGIGTAGALAAVYGADWAAVEWKIHRNAQAFADVRVDQVYTSTNKWQQVDWSRGTTVTERCVYALFPHFGDRPCWYVQKHTMRITNTD